MFRFDLIKNRIDQESLSAIARRSGVSIDTVARAGNGENLSIKSLAAIAKACDLKMPDLFSFEDPVTTEGLSITTCQS